MEKKSPKISFLCYEFLEIGLLSYKSPKIAFLCLPKLPWLLDLEAVEHTYWGDHHNEISARPMKILWTQQGSRPHITLAHPWDWILITLGDLWIMENNFWRPITQEKFEILDTLVLNPITPSRNITPEGKHAYLPNIFFKYTINVLILRSFYLGWCQLLLLKHTYPHWGYLRWCQIVDSKSTYPHWG